MRTSNIIFSTPPRRSRLREFFANLGVLLGAGRRHSLVLKSRPADVKYTDVPEGRVPARGLIYSFLAHEVAIFAILTVSTAIQLARTYRHTQEIWRQKPEERLTYVLPELGGGSSGEEPAPAKPAPKEVAANHEPALPKKQAAASPEPQAQKPGLVYPAPQPIVSNPLNPTNHIQTIMRPELVNPPALKVPLALPNIVTIARATDRPTFTPKVTAPPPSPAKTPSAPVLGPERHPLGWHFVNVQLNEPLPTPPQLALPVVSSNKFTPLPQNPSTQVPKVTNPQAPATPEAGALKPELAKNTTPAIPGVRERVSMVPKVSAQPSSSAAAPQSAELKPEFGGGTDEQSVLVLSPTPAAPTPNPSVPPGEARGQFAMGPNSNLKAPPGSGIGLGAPGGTGTAPTATNSAGGEGGGTPSTAGGSGEGSGTAGGGGGASKGSENGTGNGNAGTAPGGSGSGPGIAAITGGTGSGAGLGGTPGKGAGTGTGTGTGPGTGAGSGPGTSPFSGITITGGSGGGVAKPAVSPTKTPPATHPTYGMSIVATASSGGGLRDYGIFRNETAYTVYLDRSQAAAPSWTLEYAEAVAPPPDPMVSSLKLSSSGAASQITPPYPMDEEDPQFPPDVLARNQGRMMVITGNLTAEGKFSNLRVIVSPNPLLNAPALEALSKWNFRPAERAGQAVQLKILLGIPLPAAPQ